MQSITEVQEALYEFLLTISGIPAAIQVENERFIPSIRDPWMRVLLVPGETTLQSLGTDGYNRLSGLYLIDLFYPAGRKTVTDINAIADTIINSYINENIVTKNTTHVQILGAWRNTSISEGDWFQVPLSIRWNSQATRNV